MNRKGIEMNRIIKFFVGLLILAAFFKVGYAGERGPGKYCGVVVFDRWDGCILYSGIYVMYISEDVKENLRKYAGNPVQINATKVFQPINPGDGLIKEFEYLGPAREKRKWVSLAGLKLKSFPAFEDGEKPSVTMELLNAGEEDLEVFSSELAPTLLTTQSSKTRTFSPSDGPSIALITRQSFCVGGSEYRWEGGGVTQGGRCSWTIRKENALPRKFVLKAGQEKQIVITFDLPEGEYEFLCGYGGGTHGSKCLASNLVYFDVDKNSKGMIVECSSEVVNGLQLVLSSKVRPDGQPKLVIHWRNAGSKPFDIVEMAPLFLEVQESQRHWRAFQHPRWDSSKLGKMFTFEPGHDESETEPVSAFATLPPGKYLVRVSMAFDRGMSQKYRSNRLWTGLVRSNTVEITVPKDEGDSPLP